MAVADPLALPKQSTSVLEVTLAVGFGLIFIKRESAATESMRHPMVSDEAAVTLILSLSVSTVVVKLELLVPTLAPFLVQAYTGEPPPLVGAAVNVTLVPEQTLGSEVVTLTDTVVLACTDIVTESDEMESVTQPVVIFEAMVTFTSSL
jgi:hypothetical protein